MANSDTTRPNLKKDVGFQTRFLLVIATILVFFSGTTAFIIYKHEVKNLEENAFEKTDLVMKSIEANRDYVQEILRPTMFKELQDETFILEAMSSSYISRMIMERFNKKAHGFFYRRVSINAKNSEYEANHLETEMIERFRKDSTLVEWQGVIELKSNKYYMRFQPVVFKSACLTCHGDPADAPKKVRALYGTTAGFFHKPDQIDGVISVGMPIDLNLDRINTFALALFAGVLPSIFIVYVIIGVFFNRYIATNLRNILSFFHANITDGAGRSILENSQKIDEIDELTTAARAIADHLHNKQLTLEKYAAEVKASKDLLQSVFDGISDPVVLVDGLGKIKIVNDAFLKRYSLTMPQVLGQTPSDLVKNECCPLAGCSDVFKSMPVHPISREVQIESGEIFLIYFYPIQSSAGETESMVCYVKDISEQKKLEAKIQQTEKIASIGQMAAGIAHEINNPLGVILCHIDLIKGDANLSPEVRSDLEIIEKHTGNCQNIVTDLLKFAHQHVSAKKSVSVNGVIEEVVLMLNSQFKKQQINMAMHLDNSIPLVTLDAEKIKQVILNMLLNSAQAMEKKGNIEIFSHYQNADHCLKIIIEDDGPGIPAAIIDKIFDPFFTTKSPGKGTGLGLSVSYGIVKDHDGEIAVDSIPGKLTRFVITLPVSGEKQ
jgi:PAS domain S-box-containing protein